MGTFLGECFCKFSLSSSFQKYTCRSSLVAQQVKDLVLSLLRCGFSPWPGNFHILWSQPQKCTLKNTYTCIKIYTKIIFSIQIEAQIQWNQGSGFSLWSRNLESTLNSLFSSLKLHFKLSPLIEF